MYFFRGSETNFGDELNLWLWPQLFGDIWNDSDPDIFLGIGSILYDGFPLSQRKIVFGAGFGGYTGKPDIHDGSWDVYFVRGPQTAEVLGLDPALALTDAAILVRTLPLPSPERRPAISFMPHFESIARGNWEAVCAYAGIGFIDPRDPVATVLSQILGSKLLLTEAMHGAIVADSLRVPWVPFLPVANKHRFKWLDWTRSIETPLHAVSLKPSSAREAWILATGRDAESPSAKAWASGAAGQIVDRGLIPRAARHLMNASKGPTYLSADPVVEQLTERAVGMVNKFRRDFNV
jgi:succinoglycan biosynthesis protein ExoV